MQNKLWLYAQWPAPHKIIAGTTTRLLNCTSVFSNKSNSLELIKNTLYLPAKPYQLNQTHSAKVINLDRSPAPKLEGDASFTTLDNTVCMVLTADCLPLLICNEKGTEIAALHCGWRGLSKGIIENTLSQLRSPREKLLVWMGPSIGPKAFEVGNDVRDAFLKHSMDAGSAFMPAGEQNKYYADIYKLAKQRLTANGIIHIYGGEYCTYMDKNLFFSYRREGKTGRMASLIWINQK